MTLSDFLTEGNAKMDEKEVTIGAGQVLFRQNEKGGDLYFIKTGTVELTVRNEETGEEAMVAVIGDRSVVGTMSFLEGEPRALRRQGFLRRLQ